MNEKCIGKMVLPLVMIYLTGVSVNIIANKTAYEKDVVIKMAKEIGFYPFEFERNIPPLSNIKDLVFSPVDAAPSIGVLIYNYIFQS